ncbi:MAG: helix-turn-helix transcriptional regulator [Parahaliea sp.]
MANQPELSVTFLRLPQVQAIVPYSRSMIYTMIADGEFPPPVKLGKRASAWVKSEVEAWAESRIAEREDSAA